MTPEQLFHELLGLGQHWRVTRCEYARLTVNYSEWLIEDLGSATGTRVDGEPVTAPRRIFSGQRLECGAATVELHPVHGATELGASLPPDLAAVRALLPETVVHGQRYSIGPVVAHGGMGAILAARSWARRNT